MEVSFEFKCAVTTAILSVLVYLLLVNLMSRVWVDGGVGKGINDTDWFKSMEVIMLVSVLLGYNINGHLFSSCKSA